MNYFERLRDKYGVKAFILCSSLCALAYLSHITYFNGSLRMIEKAYGLSARQTGIMDGADNSMVIAFLLIYGYLGDRYNKPRLIGFGTSMIALSSFVMALPYFIISPPSREESTNGTSGFEYSNETGGFVRARVDLMCPAENKTCSSILSHQDLATSAAGTRAFYIFVAGRFIFGFGASSMYTLMVSYIYENSDKHKSPLYLGIMHATFLLGPITGYLMAGATNRLPVDLKDYSLKPTDPRFIGCWWIGFVVAGVIGVLGFLPIAMFPARIKSNDGEKGKDQARKTGKKDNGDGFGKYVKEFFRTVRNLVTSPLYILYVVSKIFVGYVVVILLKVLARYLEFHFRLPVYQTSLIKGGGLTVPALIGSLLGGFILSHFKLRDVTIARMVATMILAQVVLVGLMMSLQCPQTEYVGFRVEPHTGSVNLSTSCSMPCKCDVSGAQPVCGSDGRDYFTPCHAGCTGVSLGGGKVNFTNCQCVPGGWAVQGHCMSSCNLVIPYVLIKAISGLCASTMSIPWRILIIRAIPAEAKAFGLAFASFTYNLLSSMPGPMVSGALVDTTCLIWQRRCGRRGSCLQYNMSSLRALTHGGGMLCFFLSSCAAWIAYMIHRRMAKREEQENGDVTAKLNQTEGNPDNLKEENTSPDVDVEMKCMDVMQNGKPDLVKPGENGALLTGKGA